jgi:hypothetical protein
MSDAIDRAGAAGVDRVAGSGLSNERLMKSDPVWAALRGEIGKLQALVIDLKVQHNALQADVAALRVSYDALVTSHNLVLAQLDTNTVAGNPYNVVANQGVANGALTSAQEVKPNPAL